MPWMPHRVVWRCRSSTASFALPARSAAQLAVRRAAVARGLPLAVRKEAAKVQHCPDDTCHDDGTDCDVLPHTHKVQTKRLPT